MANYTSQPSGYLSVQSTVNAEVRAYYEYLIGQRELWLTANFAAGEEPVDELSEEELNAQYYQDFFTNCSHYLLAFVVEDRIPALTEDANIELVPRTRRLFQRKIEPLSTVNELNKIRFGVN